MSSMCMFDVDADVVMSCSCSCSCSCGHFHSLDHATDHPRSRTWSSSRQSSIPPLLQVRHMIRHFRHDITCARDGVIPRNYAYGVSWMVCGVLWTMALCHVTTWLVMCPGLVCPVMSCHMMLKCACGDIVLKPKTSLPSKGYTLVNSSMLVKRLNSKLETCSH